MFNKFALLALAAVAGILAACGGRGSVPNAGMGGSYVLPAVDDLAISATLPKHAIGEDLPSVLGTMKSQRFGGTAIGGFTQTQWSQTLAFPPGTRITIHNLSKSNTPHTFNVLMVATGKVVHFPQNPQLLTTASGGHKLEVGYRSGVINAGKSVTVTLAKAGTYLIGCAFHYASDGMRDVIVVKAGAKPGPEATPPSSGGGHHGGGGWEAPH